MNNNEMKPASSRESISETSKRTRRVLDDAFKAKVALAALKEDKPSRRGNRGVTPRLRAVRVCPDAAGNARKSLLSTIVA